MGQTVGGLDKAARVGNEEPCIPCPSQRFPMCHRVRLRVKLYIPKSRPTAGLLSAFLTPADELDTGRLPIPTINVCETKPTLSIYTSAPRRFWVNTTSSKAKSARTSAEIQTHHGQPEGDGVLHSRKARYGVEQAVDAFVFFRPRLLASGGRERDKQDQRSTAILHH